MTNLIDEFVSATSLVPQTSKLGSSATTLCIGGPFTAFVTVNSDIDLVKTIRFLMANNQSYRIIGNGSNVLISDEGLSDWVIHLSGDLRSLDKVGEDEFYVGGAYSLTTLSRQLSNDGYSGLEFAGGIPASLGGAVYMNAGAHGGEMSSVIRNIKCIDSFGTAIVLNKNDLSFTYRNSGLSGNMIVIGATLKVKQSDKEKVSALRSQYLKHRKLTQPLTVPSSGSVFKNPGNDVYAGAVIERLGLKGFQIGDVQISNLHANWIVNPNKKGSFRDVISLIERCESAALMQLDIVLERELKVWE